MSAVKNIIALCSIGIIIYIIISFHSVLGSLLHDIETLGYSTSQAFGSLLEKLECCTQSCPGKGTKCSTTQVNSMKGNQGFNICDSPTCTPPCELPSYSKGMSCTELYLLIGAYPFIKLLGYFVSKYVKYRSSKSESTDKQLEDEIENTGETESSMDVFDEEGQVDNDMDNKDFKKFGMDTDEEKTEYRTFMKKGTNFENSDIPDKVKAKLNGDLPNIKQWVTSRTNVKKILIKQNSLRILKNRLGKSGVKDSEDVIKGIESSMTDNLEQFKKEQVKYKTALKEAGDDEGEGGDDDYTPIEE